MLKQLIALVVLLTGLTAITASAQSTSISGTVTSSPDGLPLAGVTVSLKNGKATSTDADGRFTIAAAPKDELIFSFVGYKTKQVTIGANTTTLTVSLERGENAMNEVVVTALGITRQRKALGYAVQELKAKDIAEAQEGNIVNALAGKVAGVRITNTQGDMGSARIVIRGETSIQGNNQPLFVVDGVPVDNSQFGAGGSRDFPNAISDINSEDIESISILKGPNAAALYGSRAAHGVVLIKTKTGKRKQGLGITINNNTTFDRLLTLPKYQNVFGQGSNGQFSYKDGKGGGINDGVDESWGPKMDGRLIPQFYSNGEPVPFLPHPDNVRDYFRTGFTLANGVAIADAGDKYDYRLSYNNSHQEGIVPNSELNKHSFALNTSFKLTPKLTVSGVANYLITDAPNLPGAGGRRATATMLQFTWFGRQVDINRLRPYKNPDGSTFNWNNSYYSNPFFIAYENTVQQRRDRIIGHVALNYKITDYLSANFRTGTDHYNDRRKLKIAYGTSGTPFGSYTEEAYRVTETNTEAMLNFNKKLNGDFALEALGGWNLRTKTYEENIQQAPRLAVADVYTLTNSRDPLVSSNYYSKQKIYSFFGSAQLSFRNYAFLNLTARNDWSSTLPRANLSYFYPSVNASVILTDALDISSSVLNYLKVRGGWSEVGNDAEAPYQLYNVYNFNAPFGNNPQLTANPTDLNPDLRSEKVRSTELGVEAGFFNNRARLDLSVYNTNSFDQILKVDVSASTGYTSKLLNAGKINNKGIEVQLAVTPVQTKAFNWDVTVNYAANRSRVEELDQEGRLQNYVLGSYRSVEVIAGVGKPYGTLFGNAFLRNEKGEIIVNAQGLPQANPAKQVLGKFTPDWIGGIINSFSYKNFSLSVLVDASVGGQLFAGTNSTGSYTGVLASTLHGRDAEHGGLWYYYPNNDKSKGTVALTNGATAGPAGEAVYDDGIIWKGVTADGKANTAILPAQQYYKAARSIEEEFVYDATYVKLREVRLGYNLPAAWIKKIGLTAASVALVGRNLWIIHKDVPNIDPETSFTNGNVQGLEDLTLPTTRSFGFNINLKF